MFEEDRYILGSRGHFSFDSFESVHSQPPSFQVYKELSNDRMTTCLVSARPGFLWCLSLACQMIHRPSAKKERQILEVHYSKIDEESTTVSKSDVLQTERDIVTHFISVHDDPSLSPWTFCPFKFFIGLGLLKFGGGQGAAGKSHQLPQWWGAKPEGQL